MWPKASAQHNRPRFLFGKGHPRPTGRGPGEGCKDTLATRCHGSPTGTDGHAWRTKALQGSGPRRQEDGDDLDPGWSPVSSWLTQPEVFQSTLWAKLRATMKSHRRRLKQFQ